MRAQADDVLPTNSGIHKSSTAFFRRGSSGAGAEELNCGRAVALPPASRRTRPSRRVGLAGQGVDAS